MCEDAQQLRSEVERFRLLAVAEADFGASSSGVAVEAAAGDDGDAEFVDEPAREFDVMIPAEASDVGHDVVRAVRFVDVEAGLAEQFDHEIALASVEAGETAEVVFDGRRRSFR